MSDSLQRKLKTSIDLSTMHFASFLYTLADACTRYHWLPITDAKELHTAPLVYVTIDSFVCRKSSLFPKH